MAKVELKQPVVQAIAEDVKDAVSVVLVDYRGLTVAEDTEMRKQLREAGVVYKVCKNTMMKRAFEGTDFAQLDEYLEGPNAIAISKEDATAPARIICDFAKKAEALEVKAGVVEGSVYDAAGIQELSKIPSREVLLSKLLGSLQIGQETLAVAVEKATIIPAANPASVRCSNLLSVFLIKNTHAAPSVVPTNGISIPSKIFIRIIFSFHICSKKFIGKNNYLQRYSISSIAY